MIGWTQSNQWSKAFLLQERNLAYPELAFKASSGDYISLTDIARHKNPDEPKDVVKNWMRSKNTIEFLGLWEKINNQNFKGVEFDSFWQEAGANAFVLSPSKWIENTDAIGIISKAGKKLFSFFEIIFIKSIHMYW